MGTESSAASQQQSPTTQGAGGKFRRQLPRKFPATPYARPPHPQAQRGSWLSRLVDPAYRLLSTGATRVLPSLLSKSPEDSISAETELRGSSSERDEFEANGGENAGNDAPTCTSNFGVPDSAKDNGVSRSCNGLRNGSLLGGHVDVGMSNTAAIDGLSEIEKLLKGKTFSSDQIKRLTEVMKSRVVDQESSDFILMQNGGLAREPTSSLQCPQELPDRTQQNVGKVLQGSSTPLSHSTAGEKIVASPIDIAKAYMARQKSEVSPRSAIFQDEKHSYLCDDLASNSYLPSPSPRQSTCWPGAIVHDLQDYLTPQSQKGRFGFPRTPYSRTIYSGSKPRLSRLQGDNSAINRLSGPFKQPQTNEQLKSSSVSKGSVGPIRRVRHRVAAGNSLSGAGHVNSLFNGAFKVGNDDCLGAFSSPKESFELEGTSGSSNFQSSDAIPRRSDNRIPAAHPHSSLIAKTIWEHLDRNPPTPQAKSGELKMASWQDMGLSNVNTAFPKEQNSRPYFEEFQFSKQTDGQQKQISRQLSVETSSFPPSIPLEGAMQKDKLDGITSDLRIKSDASIPRYKAGSLDHLGKSLDSRITDEIQMHPCQSSGNKPLLPSISVSNRDQKALFTADGSTGFTFPVSGPNGVFPEPPTPSFMPSLSTRRLQQQKEEQTIPSFEFGAKRSSPALVFSFPSTSRVDGHVRDSDITFKFGSESSSRLSFSSISRDAACC